MENVLTLSKVKPKPPLILGNSVTFYQMADKIDNDGDGCIDEELRDGIDNDGDGIIDEDTKFDPFNARDSFDNDQNGQIDEGDELISMEAFWPSPLLQDFGV
jgi:hypothetical protein